MATRETLKGWRILKNHIKREIFSDFLNFPNPFFGKRCKLGMLKSHEAITLWMADFPKFQIPGKNWKVRAGGGMSGFKRLESLENVERTALV